MERVNWHDAVEFCDRLSLYSRSKYRLPSEAEWEYACRAGTTTPFYFGEKITPDVANYKGGCLESTTEVGRYPANAFGLCDMHGNVFEWCADIDHGNYECAPADGSAWLEDGNDEYRILRGGSWDYDSQWCRSGCRLIENPSVTKKEFGFRVVREEISHEEWEQQQVDLDWQEKKKRYYSLGFSDKEILLIEVALRICAKYLPTEFKEAKEKFNSMIKTRFLNHEAP